MSFAHLLEIAVGSYADAKAAWLGGADRLELCSSLAVGGLTPSLGSLQLVKEAYDIPVVVMLRPREGGMSYSDAEYQCMVRDAEIFLEHGADGLVFGFLTDDGKVDEDRCRTMLRHIESATKTPAETVFHRAFDVTEDGHQALEQLIDLGFTRVLTSGRSANAEQGIPEILRTVEQAGDRIEVLPGGGIDLRNMTRIIRRTKARQIHLYPFHVGEDPSVRINPEIDFGNSSRTSEQDYFRVDEASVRRARAILEHT